jgi:methionyl aminopeptidase
MSAAVIVLAVVGLVLTVVVVVAVRLLRRPRARPEDVARRVAALAPDLEALFVALRRELRPGVSTLDLERRAAALLEARGLRGYLKGYRGYPSLLSASVNDEVADTPPTRRPLTRGDLVKIQVGVSDGVAYACQAWTLTVGEPERADIPLLRSARAALDAAVAVAVVGRTTRDVTDAIHARLGADGFAPSRHLFGHQIGSVPRKGPQIPCDVGASQEAPAPLLDGMVLSLVVAGHAGGPEVEVADDGWNVVAVDGSRSVLLSHLVVVRRGRCQRLTADLG